MSALVVPFTTKRDTTPRPPAPPSTEATHEYLVRIERRSSGEKRSFWVDAYEVRRQAPASHMFHRGVEPKYLTETSLRGLARDIWRVCPPANTDGEPELRVRIDRNYYGGNHLSIVVQSGRWRVWCGLDNETSLSAEVRTYLATLPLTDDSYTAADEAADAAERERLSAINRKLTQYRRLLTKHPVAAEAVGALIDKLLTENASDGRKGA